MSNAPEILREAPPQVTMLTGDESAPDPATLAAISSLVRRYSSHAYIHRAHALLRGVHDAFLGWAGDAPMPNAILRFTAGKLAGALESFAAGLAALARGHRTTAHDHVLSAVAVHTTLTDARSDRGMSLDVMQQRLPPPAAAAAVRFCAMAVRIQHTLTATWTVETILGDRLGPRRLPDAPPPSSSTWLPALEQRTGAEVERTGIWIPTTIRNGCPNLLVAGHPAPPLTRAGKRITYPAWPGNADEPARASWSVLSLTEEPTTWRLVWLDERYRDGLIVPEPEFLDEDNAIPEGLA
jgi:hypothetical protein